MKINQEQKLTVHANGVGLYSFKIDMAFGDARTNVSEVIAHVFFLYTLMRISITKINMIMKHVLLLLMLMVAMSAGAQEVKDSVKNRRQFYEDGMYYEKMEKALPTNVRNPHLYKAGRHQQSSVYFECGAILSGAAAGVACTDIVFKEKDARVAAGVSLGVVSFLCIVASLEHRFKSGTELKLSATGLQLTF